MLGWVIFPYWDLLSLYHSIFSFQEGSLFLGIESLLIAFSLQFFRWWQQHINTFCRGKFSVGCMDSLDSGWVLKPWQIFTSQCSKTSECIRKIWARVVLERFVFNSWGFGMLLLVNLWLGESCAIFETWWCFQFCFLLLYCVYGVRIKSLYCFLNNSVADS